VVMLAKCDFSPLLLARCIRFENTLQGGEYVFYQALNSFPSARTVGSMGLFSELHPNNFDPRQLFYLSSLADPSFASLRQVLRFWKRTSMEIVDFLWALVFVLPHWTGFDFSGESIFERSDSEDTTSWGGVRLADSWAATWFFSWPFSAQRLFAMQDFTHSYFQEVPSGSLGIASGHRPKLLRRRSSSLPKRLQ
jgi:hypothetical protein